MNLGIRKILKSSLKKELKKEKNFFKITKTNKRSNINIISCNDNCFINIIRDNNNNVER